MILLSASRLRAQQQSSTDDLRNEIKALTQTVKEMQKDLQEIKASWWESQRWWCSQRQQRTELNDRMAQLVTALNTMPATRSVVVNLAQPFKAGIKWTLTSCVASATQ